ncbi:MAG TPA: septal ring lytic transglycosylase RlpA family protein [Stellaceae bacterium]|jgi:rare lipoprotein A|nr:septal ring lytic transglycosylase RlpA family protein [Stellaceae bacterium]
MKHLDRGIVGVAGLLAVCVLIASAASAENGRPKAKAKHGTRVGIASVYSDKFKGRKTASGQTFTQNKLTAASRDLPLNSKAKVTNLDTGRSTEVTINDRGPFKKGRTIDLSKTAAKKIGVTRKDGIAPVAVKPLTTPQPEVKEPAINEPQPKEAIAGAPE